MTSATDDSKALLSISFNQDAVCFSVGASTGFRIYNVEPFKEMYHRDFEAGIGLCEMLYRCNFLVLVGGGTNPRFPSKKAMIWDDHQQRCRGELSFRSKVLRVRLRRERIVCALSNKVYYYDFKVLNLLDRIETVENPLGLLALSAEGDCVLACPGLKLGSVRVKNYTRSTEVVINAHSSELMALAVNNAGTKVCTASEKGTLIRVFDAATGEKTHELRRGAERAVVHSLCFDSTSSWLGCSSDKGTVHVFSLDEDDAVQDPASKKNASSSLSFLGTVLPSYFSSTWSYAQFRIPETRSICAFGAEKNTIVVVGGEGTFYKASFEGGGQMKRLHYAKFADDL